MSVLLVQPYRFTFRCEDPVYFPAGMLTNHLRGAFGLIFRRMVCRPGCSDCVSCSEVQTCPYARLFSPRLEGPGPADMADLPRSFLLRPPTLRELHLAAGQTFTIDLHLFDLAQPFLRYFIWALSQLADEGLGAGRPRVQLESVARLSVDCMPQEVVFDKQGMRADAEQQALCLSFESPTMLVTRLRLVFHTPTELKHHGTLLREPHFPAIIARARDRISALSRFYQNTLLEADFRGLGERAHIVRLLHSKTQQVSAERQSLRTGIRHELGGFLGHADYEGDLTEFVPYLRAAYWTGIGKQTVWGHGAIQTILLTSPPHLI